MSEKQEQVVLRREVMWCTVCGARFTQEEIKGWGCPKCGDQGVPCGCTGDVRVEVNWHELHVLIVWAENYAASIKDPRIDGPTVVAAIARRLQRQHPDLSPLTLAEEIAGLPAALEKSGIDVGGIEVHGKLERPKPIPVNGPGAVGHARTTAPAAPPLT